MRAIRAAVLVAIAAGVVFTIIGAAYISLTRRNFARPEALDALNSDEDVVVSQPAGEDWLVFTPAGETPTTGFIIYPGGFVDPEAYTPVARGIAEQGFLVVIDPMPLGLGVLGIEGADSIIAAMPQISAWGIGGHSLGGAMAAEYTARNPESIDALALWAAYPAKNTDLSGLDLEAVSIYGDADGVASMSDVGDGATRLPEETNFVLIPGGNHTQFGAYGDSLQRGDSPATIGRDEQKNIIVANTAAMLSSIEETN